MPMYDYRCPACGFETEHINKIADRNGQQCDSCGDLMVVQIGVGRYIPFKEGYYEHIDKNPIYISSMRQLKDECAKRNVTSVYAEDSV